MKTRTAAFMVATLAGVALIAPGSVGAFCEIAEPPSPLPTQVNGTQVEIRLTEGFARVVIIKEFYNPSDEFKEGQVFFPLERGRELITDLRLRIGNVVYDSKPRDRGEALDDFLDALRAGQDAALVQYDAPRDVYWIAVTIPPKQTRTTITTLEMPLAARDGLYAYDYRLSVDARDSRAYLKVRIIVDTTDRLEEVRIPTHRHVPIFRTGERSAEAWLNSTEESLGFDLRVEFRSNGLRASQLVLPNGDRYVRLTMDASSPAFAGSLDPRPRSFLVFVDASGSMGRSGRWSFATDTVLELLDRLVAGESFALAAFQASKLVPFSPSPLPEDAVSEGELRAFLGSVKPRGSTNFASVLDRARTWAREAHRQGQQPLLFLISDGRVTQGPKSLDLENAFRRAAYEEDLPMSGFVIRPEDHADDNAVRNLTHFNGGAFYTIQGDYIPAAVTGVLDALRLPVLHDVGVSRSDDESVALATLDPQRVVAGGELLILFRERGSPADPVPFRIAWTGKGGLKRSFAFSLEGASIPQQSLLLRQWALTRIHTLLDELRGGRPELLEELKAIATEHRVVTPYTSLVVTIPIVFRDSSRSEAEDLFQPPAIAEGLAAPGPLGSRDVASRLSPLGAEAQTWRDWREDASEDLLTNDEVDRWVSSDDTAAVASFDQERLANGYAVVLQGRFVTVYEGPGELIGVRDPILDPASATGRAAAQGVWAALAVTSLVGVLLVHMSAFGTRRRLEPLEEDPGYEG